MKRMLLSLVTALVFFVAAAVAQSTPQSDTQGAQGGSYPSAAGQGTSNPNAGMQGTEKPKGEKKLKGCIQSQGGSYMLQEKSGKNVALTGADLSAHVGHEVAVHGSWESSAGSSGAASTGGGMSNDKMSKQFNVTSVDMISESCGGSKKGGMSNPPSSQQPQ